MVIAVKNFFFFPLSFFFVIVTNFGNMISSHFDSVYYRLSHFLISGGFYMAPEGILGRTSCVPVLLKEIDGYLKGCSSSEKVDKG